MIKRGATPLAVLWAVGILVLTLMPSSGVPRWPWAAVIHLDKIVHLVLFGVLGVLWGWALEQLRPWARPLRPYLVAFLAAVLYGAVIELVQGAMAAGRSGDLGDLLADALGALIGYGFLRWRHGRTALR